MEENFYIEADTLHQEYRGKSRNLLDKIVTKVLFAHKVSRLNLPKF